MIDLQGKNIVYVTRDIERALGLSCDTQGYHIISNSTGYAKSVKANRENVLLIEEDRALDTWELLEHELVLAYIKELTNPSIVVFKNTPKIERICKEQNLSLLNPSADLANTIEEKISQVEWLGGLSAYLPPHKVLLGKEIAWTEKPFVLQFNRAHTGSGTTLITSLEDVQNIQTTFPDRPVRVTEFIEAPTFTANIMVDSQGNVLVSSPSLQITGIAPFTSQPFATVGNDWSLAKKMLNDIQKNKIHEIAHAVGKRMHEHGWVGLFGIDYLVQKNSVYLMEINARQPASVSYESRLQKNNTTFEAHLYALLGQSLKNYLLSPVHQGAQVILRCAEGVMYDIEHLQKAIEKMGPHVIAYEYGHPGIELLRIQSMEGLMEDPRTPNALLSTIIQLIHEHRQRAFSGTSESESTHLKLGPLNSHVFKAGSAKKEILGRRALEVIDQYEHLRFGSSAVPCPYFNNRRTRLRGALRPLIGKGAPQEIIEEAEIIALREKVNLPELKPEIVTRFLVDHNLGIDCSGFVFHVLNAEVKEKKHTSLARAIKFKKTWNPLRMLIRTLRIAENFNVQVLAHGRNSRIVQMNDVQPGDVIVMLHSGQQKNRDHVVLIHEVEYSPAGANAHDANAGRPQKIHYVHTFQWSTDGKYNHGVRKGIIEIRNPNATIVEQKWIEQNVEGEQNETWKRARDAEKTEIRRLAAM